MSKSYYNDRKEKILQTLKETDGFRSFYSQHLRLIPSGRGKAKALCPFHDDKKPSLSINLEDGRFHCFGCQEGGDIFTFRMKIENIHFNECLDAFEQLQTAPSHSERPKETVSPSPIALPSMQDVLEWHEALFDEKNIEVRRFLNVKRGITDETIRQFKLGYDLTKGALVIPIFTPDGDGIDGAKMFRYDLSTGEKHVWTIGSAHLFGVHLLLRDYERHGFVVVCEGELDSVVLNQSGILAVSGSAGAAVWKPEWNDFFKGKNVALCYDSDSAGRAGALKALNELRGIASSIKNLDLFGSAATKDLKDITDFFVTAGKKAEDFFQIVESTKLVQSSRAGDDTLSIRTLQAENQVRLLSSEQNSVALIESPAGQGSSETVNTSQLRSDILSLLESGETERRRNELAEKSFELLTSIGRFMRDKGGNVFYFSSDRRRVYPLESQLFSDLVSTETQVNPASINFNYILSLTEVRARATAERGSIYRFSHYDPVNHVLYLAHQYDACLRISPDTIDAVPNGTDNIYFVFDWPFQPFEYNPLIAKQGVRVAKRLLVERINFDDGQNGLLSRKEYQVLYWNMIRSIPFLSSSRTKPVIALIGGPGSGKTTSPRLLGKALTGEGFEVTSPSADERDLMASFSRRPIVVLDNLDKPTDLLLDMIARAATGASTTRRRLYTNNDELEIYFRAHLMITSMAPFFNREDIADRLMLFRLSRIEENDFLDESVVVGEVLQKRNLIMSGYVLSLQLAVRNVKRRENYFKKTTFRMATAALLMIRMSDEPMKMVSLFDKMQNEQVQFMAEGDALTELICQWLGDNQRQEGNFLKTADLFTELNLYAQSKKIKMPVRSARSLGMALSNRLKALETRLVVTRDNRKTNNLKWYSFTVRKEN